MKRLGRRAAVLSVPCVTLSVLTAWTLDLFFRSSTELMVDQLITTESKMSLKRLAFGIFFERYWMPILLWIVFITILFACLLDGQRRREQRRDIDPGPLRFMRVYYVVMALTSAVALPGSFRTAVNETIQYGRLGNVTTPALVSFVYAAHPLYITMGLILSNIICSWATMQCMHSSGAWY